MGAAKLRFFSLCLKPRITPLGSRPILRRGFVWLGRGGLLVWCKLGCSHSRGFERHCNKPGHSAGVTRAETQFLGDEPTYPTGLEGPGWPNLEGPGWRAFPNKQCANRSLIFLCSTFRHHKYHRSKFANGCFVLLKVA